MSVGPGIRPKKGQRDNFTCKPPCLQQSILGVPVCMKPSLPSAWDKTRDARFLPYVYAAYIISWNVNCCYKKKKKTQKNQHVNVFLVDLVSKSQNICACADGMFKQERKTQYLQTPALERRTKRVIPGFRPVRSLLDAVGPSLLSATDPSLPVRHWGRDMSAPKPYVTNPTPTHSSKPPLSI